VSLANELIAGYRPDGVAYRSVASLATYTRGVTYSKSDEQFDGSLRVLRSNNITLATNSLNFDDVKRVASTVRVRSDQWLRADDILISVASGSKAHVGKVAFIKSDIDYCFGGFMAVLRSTGQVEARFLFHSLVGSRFNRYLSKSLASTTINNLNASTMGAFMISLPPLPVQRAIVDVLDRFTESEAELEVELEAEIEARRCQYEHYRDRLLSFREQKGVPSVPLGDLATFIRGSKGDRR